MENLNSQPQGQQPQGQQAQDPQPQGQQYYNPQPQGQQAGMPYASKPDSNLLWGVLATALCCVPFGVVSIIKASSVDSHWNAGRYQEAYEASKSAMNWAIAAAVSSLVGIVLYLVFYFMLMIPMMAY